MYSIRFSDWGLVLEFEGQVGPDMMHDWLMDLRQLTGGLSQPFGVVIDVRTAVPGEAAVAQAMVRGLHELQNAGMVRAMVISSMSAENPWGTLQPAIDEIPGVQYVLARPDADAHARVQAWVQSGQAPDRNEGTEASTGTG